jgi:hypothetical protein
VAERKVSERSGEDRSCRFRTGLEFSPVIKSRVPETLKKISLFCGGMIAALASKEKHHNQRKRRQNLKKC